MIQMPFLFIFLLFRAMRQHDGEGIIILNKMSRSKVVGRYSEPAGKSRQAHSKDLSDGMGLLYGSKDRCLRECCWVKQQIER
jgi:hypothetical protein